MIAVRLFQALKKRLNIFKTKIEVFNRQLHFVRREKETECISYELGKSLFGKYESTQNNLSSTYKDKLKEKLYEKYRLKTQKAV